jgi:hypothetical protein
MAAAVALGNRMARIIWAMMMREQNHKMARSAVLLEEQRGDALGP